MKTERRNACHSLALFVGFFFFFFFFVVVVVVHHFVTIDSGHR